MQFEGRQVHFYFEEGGVSFLPNFGNSVFDIAIKEDLILFSKIRYTKMPKKKAACHSETSVNTTFFPVALAAQMDMASSFWGL